MDEYFREHVIRVGQGEPLLLVHGLGHCKEGWDPLLPGLARDFDVAAIDLPGFAGAPALAAGAGDEELAEWCERVMDELGWDTAHVVGNSLGGLIAIRLGGRGRARTITALSPGGMVRGWEHRWVTPMLQVVKRLAPALADQRWITNTPLGRTLALSAIFGRPANMHPGYARRSMAAPGEATTFDQTLAVASEAHGIKPVDVPVTIAWGTRDWLLFPHQARRWLAELPHARMVKLPGLGHTPMPDDPDTVIDVIRRTVIRAG